MEESINLDSFEPMINACKSKQVNLFVYASTSSVYGLKKEKDIHEEMQLEPLTDYSKYKADCEKILITGSTSGLGLVCAKNFIVKKATVYVCGRKKEFSFTKK